MNDDFVAVLLRSDTFWSETCLYVFLAIGLLSFSYLLFKITGSKLKSQAAKTNKQYGAAAAVDFVLTLPIFMLVLFLTIQFALVANASLHIHYAAYSAAHSARIYYFDTTTAAARTLQLISLDNALTISKANEKKS